MPPSTAIPPTVGSAHRPQPEPHPQSGAAMPHLPPQLRAQPPTNALPQPQLGGQSMTGPPLFPPAQEQSGLVPNSDDCGPPIIGGLLITGPPFMMGPVLITGPETIGSVTI